MQREGGSGLAAGWPVPPSGASWVLLVSLLPGPPPRLLPGHPPSTRSADPTSSVESSPPSWPSSSHNTQAPPDTEGGVVLGTQVARQGVLSGAGAAPERTGKTRGGGGGQDSCFLGSGGWGGDRQAAGLRDSLPGGGGPPERRPRKGPLAVRLPARCCAAQQAHRECPGAAEDSPWLGASLNTAMGSFPRSRSPQAGTSSSLTLLPSSRVTVSLDPGFPLP